MIPEKVKKGFSVDTHVFNWSVCHNTGYLGPMPHGLVALMRAEAHMGTAGTRANYDLVTSISATCWNRRLRRRLEWVIPRVRGWRVTNLPYQNVMAYVMCEVERDLPTTLFVDPPYANAAGRAYRTNDVNYSTLGQWCQQCVDNGSQVIVCENEGATWLPFAPLTTKRVGFNTKHRKTNVGEVVWVRP